MVREAAALRRLHFLLGVSNQSFEGGPIHVQGGVLVGREAAKNFLVGGLCLVAVVLEGVEDFSFFVFVVLDLGNQLASYEIGLSQVMLVHFDD